MKILVSGFDPFGGEKINPAIESVKLLPNEIKGAKIIKLEIPTVARKSLKKLEEVIEIEKPDVVINVGQAGGRTDITVERVGTLGGLKGMVEIRRLNSTDALLMSPEQAFYVRENLRLHLLSARVALMQRQNDIYQNDLAASENAVRQYFDAATPAAQSWLREIAQLKAIQPGSGNVGDSLSGVGCLGGDRCLRLAHRTQPRCRL